MKRHFIQLMAGCLVLAVLLGYETGRAASPKKLSIAAASAGGGFYMGGSALATVINKKIPGLEATVESTGGSKNNVQLLQAGEIKIGLSATETAYESFNGKFGYEGKPHKKLRAMLAGWPSVYAFITLKKYNIRSLKDFDGKIFNAGPKASSSEDFCRRAFEVLGVKPKFVNLPTSDAGTALGDGHIQGFLISLPSAAVQELETTFDAAILTLDKDQRALFSAKYPQYVWLPIPPGQYRSLPNGGENFGLYNLFLVSSDESDDFVYSIVKAAEESIDLVKDIFPDMAKGMTLESQKYSTIPYHPGAVRYFKEKGLSLPRELQP